MAQGAPPPTNYAYLGGQTQAERERAVRERKRGTIDLAPVPRPRQWAQLPERASKIIDFAEKMGQKILDKGHAAVLPLEKLACDTYPEFKFLKFAVQEYNAEKLRQKGYSLGEQLTAKAIGDGSVLTTANRHDTLSLEQAEYELYKFVRHCSERGVDWRPLCERAERIAEDVERKKLGQTGGSEIIYEKDDVVEVIGLKAVPFWNGQLARVIERAGDRWLLAFQEFEEHRIKVKPANIVYKGSVQEYPLANKTAHNRKSATVELHVLDHDSWIDEELARPNPTGEPEILPKSSKVELHSLTAASMNGLRGVVRRLVNRGTPDERYEVVITGSSPPEVKKVKREKLRLTYNEADWLVQIDPATELRYWTHRETKKISKVHPQVQELRDARKAAVRQREIERYGKALSEDSDSDDEPPAGADDAPAEGADGGARERPAKRPRPPPALTPEEVRGLIAAAEDTVESRRLALRDVPHFDPRARAHNFGIPIGASAQSMEISTLIKNARQSAGDGQSEADAMDLLTDCLLQRLALHAARHFVDVAEQRKAGGRTLLEDARRACEIVQQGTDRVALRALLATQEQQLRLM